MRAGILFLAFLILIQSGGILLICQIEQAYIKWSFEIKANQIEHIQISKDFYETSKLSDDEIWINNNLYDIVNKIEIKSDLILFVINDKKEANVIDVIKKLCQSPFSSDKENTTSLFKLIKLVYSNQNTESIKNTSKILFTAFNFTDLSIVDFYSNIQTPPPKS